MDSIVQSLEQISGEGSVLVGEDVASRAVGIWRPQSIDAKAIVRPRSTEEVSEILKHCHSNDQVVIAHGGRTGLVEGADTVSSDLILSLERMNQIEDVDVVNRTMTVQAGALLQNVQELAESHGLFYPLDIGARGSCTIGGNIATNAGGNRVIRYGMTRDLVLGIEAVLADGTVVSSMNHMIKNNAGYDVKQLFIGTEGSLGIVTRAVLRLKELPLSQEAALVAAESFEKMPLILKHMDKKLGGALSAFEVMWQDFYRLVSTPPAKQRPPLSQDHPIYVLIESMGADPENDRKQLEDALLDAVNQGLAIDAVVAQNETERRQFWAMRDDVEQINRFDPIFIYDVSLQVPFMQKYVEEVNRGLAKRFGEYELFTFGHMGDGNLHFAVSAGADTSAHHEVNLCVYEPLRNIGGSVSAEHGIGSEKKPYLEISRNEEEIQLMRLLKSSLDPKGILNPAIIIS